MLEYVKPVSAVRDTKWDLMINVLVYLFKAKNDEEDIGIDRLRSEQSLTYADQLFTWETPLPGHKCPICQEELHTEPCVVLPCNN